MYSGAIDCVFFLVLRPMCLEHARSGLAILREDLMLVHTTSIRLKQEDCLQDQDQHRTASTSTRTSANSNSIPYRYDQNRYIGCGNITHKHPLHQPTQLLNMYDLNQYYNVNANYKPLVLGVDHVNGFRKTSVGPVKPELVPMTGYRTTTHNKLFDLHRQWDVFTPKHCKLPGVQT